uniref:Threonine synthase n=1 Tax=Arundo donax TaxID=35708 RepID=A0A0A8Z678_ARUDO
MFSSAGRRCFVAVAEAAGASEEAQRARRGRRRWEPGTGLWADEWRELGWEKRRVREEAAAAELVAMAR